MAQENTKDYTFLPDIIHKQDLWSAKQQWVKELNAKGVFKRQYKWTSIIKSA